MKIIIDLGHGGCDSGAIGQNGTMESNAVLYLGKEIEKILGESDLDVKFTRLSNKYISLGDRCKVANSFNSDYFVSIHMNSSSDTNVRGVEVWQYNNESESLNIFSNNICSDIAKALKIKNRGVKYSKDLYVLKHTKMPACLIEVDFISNLDSENFIKHSNNINLLANIISNNIKNSFRLSK